MKENDNMNGIALYFIHKSLQNDIGHVQRVVTVNSIIITVKANKHVNLISLYYHRAFYLNQ
jgi:hypothetical protein